MIGVGRASGGLADQRGDQPAAGDEGTSQPERGAGWRSVDLAAIDPVADPPGFTGCGKNGEQQAPDDRSGPDPINPLVLPEQQLENPTNQGTYKSHYLMFMVGVSTWF